MADISQIKDSINNIVYNIKDATARSLLSGKADSSHTHAAGDITSGALPIENGGTGSTDRTGNTGAVYSLFNENVGTDTTHFLTIKSDWSKAGYCSNENAWAALGGGAIGKKASLSASDIPNIDASKITSGTLSAARGGTGNTSLQATRNAMGLGNTTGAVPVANGGTGASTAANARTNLGAASTGANSFSGTQTVNDGGFIIKDSVANYTASSLSANRNRYFGSTDKNGKTYAYFRTRQMASGAIYSEIAAIHSNGTTETDNTLSIRVAADGTRSISVSDSSKWRSALGLTDMSTRPNYSVSTTDLTAGTSALTTGQLYFVYE